MAEKLTSEFIRAAKKMPPAVTKDVRDARQKGLVLRLRPSGVHTFRVSLGRGRWHTLGTVDKLTVDEARTLAQGVQGEVSKAKALGTEDPVAARKQQREIPTFEAFLEKTYGPWAREHLRSGAQTLSAAKAVLVPAFGSLRLHEITPFAVERWRTKRLKDDQASPSTVNRNLDDLRAMLTKAATWKIIAANPIAPVRRMRVDRVGSIRYLTDEEQPRLLAALAARDARLRQGREQANVWRRQRGYQEWPALGAYGDHLTPFVVTLLHTGLRRGEALALTWGDVDLRRATITVRGETAKSGQSRTIPLNSTVLDALTTWRQGSASHGASDIVFANPATGEGMADVKTAWGRLLKAAGITGFRLHDLRHTFASRLVMAGVDLVTVSRLLGHSDIRMTMRYSHLAPDHLASAVAKLVAS